MNYLSVCSGIEAATVAWHDIGFNPVGFSEIEAFPSAVLAHHYPEVTNFGDMTKFKEWNLDTKRVDLLVGGTPCQSFSVAGLRKGLDDPRGNLALTYCSMLDHFRPTWFIWENVPGVLSSSGGRDFGSFLGAVAELGYGFSYRVLDAQYFGVAQRRRRVFVVGHIGDWQRAAAVLFERQSLRRDTAPSREAWQKSSCSATPSVAKCLITKTRLCSETETLLPSYGMDLSQKAEGIGFREESATTICGLKHPGHGNHVLQPAYGIPGNWIGRAPENGGNAVEPMHDIAPCLTKTDRHGVAQPIAFHVDAMPDQMNFSTETTASLTCSQHAGVAQPFRNTADCLTSAYGTKWNGNASADNGSLFASQGMAVRRLTPIECERLQGFPDNYTNIPWRNKEESPDGPRYKALGNSMAVPVMKWIGQRIKMVDELCN